MECATWWSTFAFRMAEFFRAPYLHTCIHGPAASPRPRARSISVTLFCFSFLLLYSAGTFLYSQRFCSVFWPPPGSLQPPRTADSVISFFCPGHEADPPKFYGRSFSEQLNAFFSRIDFCDLLAFHRNSLRRVTPDYLMESDVSPTSLAASGRCRVLTIDCSVFSRLRGATGGKSAVDARYRLNIRWLCSGVRYGVFFRRRWALCVSIPMLCE